MNTRMIHHEFDTSLPEKEDFYSSLYTEDVTDADQRRVKRVQEEVEIKTQVNITTCILEAMQYCQPMYQKILKYVS